MSLIAPIGAAQQEVVKEATAVYVQRARVLFDTEFDPVPVSFDLTGRAAGMYRVQKDKRIIRYNPYLFAKYFDDNLAVTVPHEVAHYIIDRVYGLRNVRPHGREWKALMTEFGADACRTCHYDLEGVPLRNYRRFDYRCGCGQHALTSRRHHQIERGTVRYYCRRCGGALRPVAR